MITYKIHISTLLYLQSSSVFYSVTLGNFPNVNSVSQWGEEGPICFRVSQGDNAVDGSRLSVSVVSGKVFNPLVTFSFSCLFLRSKPTEEHVEWRTFNYRLWFF